MKNTTPFQIVDLFAGPGGLGEGFSSLGGGHTFDILVSAEMDPAARETLRLRAFYRALRKSSSSALDDYYEFCESGGTKQPWSFRSKEEWEGADNEARQIRLGSAEGNAELDKILEEKLDTTRPWVLIGGPPCQAYSLVGRARNRGNSEYKAEDDHRHFLYKEYLRIIQQHRPAVFVMENVKGILSSKVGGMHIFPQILKDLSDPDSALGIYDSGKTKYKIYSLSTDDFYQSGDDPLAIDSKNFVIRAEQYGIPQARHRVILLGVSEDFSFDPETNHLTKAGRANIESVIGRLPPLRSTLTKLKDTQDTWCKEVLGHLDGLIHGLASSGRKDLLLETGLNITRSSFSGGGLSNGALRMRKDGVWNGLTENFELDSWYQDPRLKVWLNHEARGHMTSDLRRYVYAAVFASAHKWSPKGHKEFDLPGLAPEHKNWESGKFCDRFKVQIKGAPSSTITSHISKDGHHFIHYDPNQCRSLTVREAARLQTFPDNYFFCGNRTQQYHQVGNAVPPLLAHKIAAVVEGILIAGKASSKSRRWEQLALG
ncbi:DNA cytosine methyltransferase [Pseudomonas sp. NPDC087697]|uniref:DNA cytosine methyltransferase n=1 Tax=Pseudomonas sp. NPDC087697 TaxID=3364447 RepID=UPI00382A04AF